MQLIQDLVNSVDGNRSIDVDGLAIPAQTLKNLLDSGFTHIEADQKLRSVLMWASDRASHLTEKQLLERYPGSS